MINFNKKIEKFEENMFLDYAENMALEHQIMTMNDWIKEADEW